MVPPSFQSRDWVPLHCREWAQVPQGPCLARELLLHTAGSNLGECAREGLPSGQGLFRPGQTHLLSQAWLQNTAWMGPAMPELASTTLSRYFGLPSACCTPAQARYGFMCHFGVRLHYASVERGTITPI